MTRSSTIEWKCKQSIKIQFEFYHEHKIMNAIKEYKQLTCIRLKNWTILNTPASMEEVARLLSDKSKDYIIVDWVGFNRLTSVDDFFPFTPNDMDLFILSQDKEVQKKLREILNERESKWLKTNWTEHLWKIYESRFISNDN